MTDNKKECSSNSDVKESKESTDLLEKYNSKENQLYQQYLPRLGDLGKYLVKDIRQMIFEEGSEKRQYLSSEDLQIFYQHQLLPIPKQPHIRARLNVDYLSTLATIINITTKAMKLLPLVNKRRKRVGCKVGTAAGVGTAATLSLGTISIFNPFGWGVTALRLSFLACGIFGPAAIGVPGYVKASEKCDPIPAFKSLRLLNKEDTDALSKAIDNMATRYHTLTEREISYLRQGWLLDEATDIVQKLAQEWIIKFNYVLTFILLKHPEKEVISTVFKYIESINQQKLLATQICDNIFADAKWIQVLSAMNAKSATEILTKLATAQLLSPTTQKNLETIYKQFNISLLVLAESPAAPAPTLNSSSTLASSSCSTLSTASSHTYSSLFTSSTSASSSPSQPATTSASTSHKKEKKDEKDEHQVPLLSDFF